jgi:hypothetical protein
MERIPESEISNQLVEHLKRDLAGFIEIGERKSLYYSLTIDTEGNTTDKADSDGELSRGGLASFQVDVVAFEKHQPTRQLVPRVAIELKSGGVSSHDLLLYSTKAAKHKEIYPYVRYGLVVFGARGGLVSKVLRHGQHFDFIWVSDHPIPSTDDLCKLAQIVRDETSQSREFGLRLGRTPTGDRSTVLRKRVSFE